MRVSIHILCVAVVGLGFSVCRVAGSTHYVDYAGGSDTYDGLYPTYQGGTNGPWKRLSKVAGASFAPGDSILFKRGASWNATLTVPSSGAPGSPITFGAYGDAADPKPRFSVVSTASSGWTSEGDGIYSRDNGFVYGLFEDGAKLVESDPVSGIADPLLENGDWDYASASSTLYYRPSSGDPANHTIQIGYSYYCIRAENKSYLDFEDLDIRYVGGGALSIRDGSHHVNVTRCDISFIYGGAVSFADTAGDCSVTHCSITKVGDGVYFANLPGDYHVVRANTITYCNYEEYNNNDGHAVGVQNTSYIIVEDNILSHCRMSPTGLWVAAGRTSEGNIYRRNIILDCKKTFSQTFYGVGIVCGPIDDLALNSTKIYGNIIARCNFGIKFNRPASPGNKIFNNTLYDCVEGFKLSHGADGNVYKNNIVADSAVLMVNSEHADNGSHNLFTHNCYHPDLTNGWKDRSGLKANFAAWQASNPAYNDPGPGSFVGDPLFVDTNSFALAGGSPCVDAGAWLTTVLSPTASGQTTFVVADATWFCDGYGIAGQTGDVLETEHGETATITSINYGANSLVVSPAIDIVQGEGVALAYVGSAPDIGAREYAGDVSPPGRPTGLRVKKTE